MLNTLFCVITTMELEMLRDDIGYWVWRIVQVVFLGFPLLIVLERGGIELVLGVLFFVFLTWVIFTFTKEAATSHGHASAIERGYKPEDHNADYVLRPKPMEYYKGHLRTVLNAGVGITFVASPGLQQSSQYIAETATVIVLVMMFASYSFKRGYNEERLLLWKKYRDSKF